MTIYAPVEIGVYAGLYQSVCGRTYVPTASTDLIQWLFTSDGVGVLAGQPVVKDAAGGEFREPQPGKGVTLPGITNRISISNDGIPNGALNFSVCWRSSGLGVATNDYLFDLRGSWSVQVASQYLRINYVDQGTTLYHTTTVVMTSAASHHFALSLSDVATLVYVDGVLQYTGDPILLPDVSTADFFIGSKQLNYSSIWDGPLNDACLYNRVLSSQEVQNVYQNDYPVSGLVALWRMDDGPGTNSDNATLRDASGNGRDAMFTGATISDVYIEGNGIPYSAQNDLGYTLSSDGVYIPADLSNPGYDVLGEPLEFSGPCSNPAKLVGSACLAVTLGSEYLQFVAIPTGAVIDSYQYTGTDPNPQIDTVNNRITFTADSQIFNIVINDSGGSLWAHLSCAEKAGEVCYDHSGNGNDGSLVGFTLLSAWAETQDTYHDHIWRGFSLYEHATDDPLYASYALSGDPLLITPPTGYTKTDDYAAGNYFPPVETKIEQYPSAKMIQAGDDFWFTAAGIPNAISYADVVAQMDAGRVMADISIPDEKKNILTFDDEQTGTDLTDAKNYLRQ